MGTTLHDIAQMPIPDSLAAVRRHFDPDWARFAFEEGPREIRVLLSYEVIRDDTFSIVVEASSVEEARMLATTALKDAEGDDVEIDYVRFYDPLATHDVRQGQLF